MSLFFAYKKFSRRLINLRLSHWTLLKVVRILVREPVNKIIAYGEDIDLILNINKTKEIIIDVRRKSCCLSSSRGLRWRWLVVTSF